MTAPANRWKLGLFVLAGCGAAVGGFTWFGYQELQRDKHTAWAFFDEALTGLEDGSPVRFRGVRIGVVDRIDPAHEDRRHLAVQMSLFDDSLAALGLVLDQTGSGEPLQTNLRAQVVTSWVTSTAFVQVDFFPDPPGGPQQLPFAARPNTLRTVPSTARSLEQAGREVLYELPAMAGAARALLEQLRGDLQAADLPALARRADAVLAAAEGQIAELRQRGTVAAATSAIAAVQQAAAGVGGEQGPAATALRELQALAADLRGDLRRLDGPGTAQSLRDAADRAAALATGLDGLGADLRAELQHLRSALGALQRLAALLERDPGALLRGRSEPPQSPLLGAPR